MCRIMSSSTGLLPTMPYRAKNLPTAAIGLDWRQSGVAISMTFRLLLPATHVLVRDVVVTGPGERRQCENERQSFHHLYLLRTGPIAADVRLSRSGRTGGPTTL